MDSCGSIGQSNLYPICDVQIYDLGMWLSMKI